MVAVDQAEPVFELLRKVQKPVAHLDLKLLTEVLKLIVERDAVTKDGATLRGPGIRDAARLNVPEVGAFVANRALFPLGLDFFFTAGDQVAALPRSTIVTEV